MDFQVFRLMNSKSLFILTKFNCTSFFQLCITAPALLQRISSLPNLDIVSLKAPVDRDKFLTKWFNGSYSIGMPYMCHRFVGLVGHHFHKT